MNSLSVVPLHGGALALYPALRHLHITCVIVTITLFVLRFVLLVRGVEWRTQRGWRWLRWLPHLNDTLLLSAAIALVVLSHQWPWQQGWIAMKIGLLVAYVLLGKRTLRTMPAGIAGMKARLKQRCPWFVAALLCVLWIVTVALTRDPFP